MVRAIFLDSVSRDIYPESDASDLYSGEERCGVFGVSCGDTTPSLEMEESIFDKMPQFIEFFVVKPLCCAVFLWGDYGFYTLPPCQFNNRVAVITTVCQQIISISPSIRRSA